LIDGLEAFSSPVAQITKAAKKELGAFLCAIRGVFGEEEVEHAADIWIAGFETNDWIDVDAEHFCRRVTIQTLARLVEARILTRAAKAASGSELQFKSSMVAYSVLSPERQCVEGAARLAAADRELSAT